MDKQIITWDQYFMGVAKLSAYRSKDPNTQVGACIVNSDNRIVGVGYNGLPRGCEDDKFPWSVREGALYDTKYPYVVHAELNAILNSTQKLQGCRIYVSLFPCHECTKAIIQSGIKEIVYEDEKYKGTERRTGMKLTIGHLYPDLLNLYGDRGNIQCFRKRLNWRGIEAEVIPVLSGDNIDFSKLDIVLLGGGSDREQELVCGYLKEIRKDFKEYVEDNGVVLAVCGGYQLLGKYYKTDKKMIEGLGILDITTEWEPERLIRNIILNSPLFDTPVVGFENHGGRTYIGDHTPFGKVFFGLGNTGKSGYEGVVYKNVIATYLHGPLLPKNPQVCDYLLERALKRKYGEEITLAPLSDDLEKQANRYIVDRYSDKKYVLKETIKRHT